MIRKFIFAVTMLAAVLPLSAKDPVRISDKINLYVNEDVTTHIIMPENIKLVDISTTRLLGNQCANNIVRIKPAFVEDSVEFYDGEVMGTVTVIAERYLTQFMVYYTDNRLKANDLYQVEYEILDNYKNPEVSMPENEMARYAWAVYGSPRKFNNIVSSKHGIKAVVNNIYSVGDYFFIDYSLTNKTRVAYDISELRVKLTDKKEVKATNSQTIELSPVFMLNKATRFKRNYRNVLVLDKLTFPDEKVLKLEISENQISGRVIELTIEYEDILNADGFDDDVLRNLPKR